MAYPIYNIKRMISQYTGKDLRVITKELADEIDMLDETFSNNVNNKLFPMWQLEMYLKYAGDFLYFLTTGKIPGIIGKEGLQVFKPIIEQLVEKGQLEESTLDILE